MPARRSAPSVPTCPCSSPCSEATRQWNRGSTVRADCRGSSASRRSAPSRCRSSRCAGSTLPTACLCVPATDPGVLRALLVKAARAHAGSPYTFCSIGLDVTDPLTSALAGCWAQTTLVHAHVGTPAGAYEGPPLGARPLHFEAALV